MVKIDSKVIHDPGFTDICLCPDKEYFITAGVGRELRIWKGFSDEDPISHVLDDDVTAVSCVEGKILVGVENRVQALTFPDGDPDGVIFRFTAPVTCIATSQDGKIIASGSCDMTVKVQYVLETRDITFEGHRAPILAVALDPNGKLIVSGSCDGTLKAWDLGTGRCLKTASVLPVSNDFGNSPIFARFDWLKDGTLLAVPTMKNVIIYETTDLEDPFATSSAFTYQSWKGRPSLAKFNHSGTYLAVATTCGEFTVFSMDGATSFHSDSPKKLKMCGLVWSDNEKDLVYTDVKGNLGTVQILHGNVKVAQSAAVENNGSARVARVARPKVVDDDDEDDGSFSISKLKAQSGFRMTEDGDTFTGFQTARSGNEVDIDDILAMVNDDEGDTESVVSTKVQVVRSVEPQRTIQEPFQPGSTPVHLTDRYMVYNYIGYVRSQNFEESILDIVFHDVTMHHNIHISNSLGHTMGDLNEHCCVLAAESSNEQPAKLVVLQLNSWDQNPEWTVDLVDEEPMCVAAGDNFVAVATDSGMLRIFTTTGIQRGLLTLAGPVVTMSGRGDKLFVVYHTALGVKSDQALGFCVAEIPFKFAPPFWSELAQPLPLSPGSTLQWVGFSDEFVPVMMDSVGLVKLLYRSSWVPILDCKKKVSNKHDNYFIVGVSEREQNIRAIFCKGSRYPAAHVTPSIQLISWQIPLCDLSSDKGVQEEAVLRLSLTEQLLPEDSIEAKQAVSKIKEGLMKLFALSSTADRDARAYSVAALMTTAHQVQLAAKYALRTQHRKLADKLHQLANQKLDEETQAEDSNLFVSEVQRTDSPVSDFTPVRAIKPADNPLLKARSIEDAHSPVPTGITPLSLGKKNPFAKKQEKQQDFAMNVLDTMSVAKTKNKEFGAMPADIQVPAKKVQKSKQMTLKDRFAGSKKTSGVSNNGDNTLVSNSSGSDNKLVETQESSADDSQEVEVSVVKEKQKLSGFALFLEENRSQIIAEFPDSPDDEIAKIAVQKFRQLSADEKSKYLDSRKRKKSGNGSEEGQKKSKVGLGGLKMFARDEKE